MTTTTIARNSKQLTFDDLKGLRAEGYIRDSTLDQRAGFGPDIQRHNEVRFAQSYGLVLGDRWYTEFVSGRSAVKRHQFQQIIEDAGQDRFDVLLVDHTSRFGRNQAECIHYKDELQRLGKIVVFVSQGIISGSDRDFVSERINETLDEQYSRNLSRYISEGLAQKAEHGLHVGPPPFGYKSELVSGRRERKAIDPTTIHVLLKALREYATGSVSYANVADHLNAQGFRLRSGKPFTGYSIRDILANRFYEGKVVYHKGMPDELVVDGCHEVPSELKELWLRCQDVKKHRAIAGVGRPRNGHHVYPFSRILRCQRCHSPYHGEAVYHGGRTDLRLTHERRTIGRNCSTWPRSRSVDVISQEFNDRVLSQLHLNDGWKSLVLGALRNEREPRDNDDQQNRLRGALNNLRKQHVWGDISDDDYRQERASLERHLKSISQACIPPELPNLERAAQLLNDLPALWSHPGVMDEQREALVQEIFSEITVDGKALVAIKPKEAYAPLFASMLLESPVGYCDLDSPPSPPETHTSLRGDL